MIEEKIKKLPKWAQQWITKLERDNKWLQDKMDSMVGDDPSTDIVIDGFLEDETPLPKGSIIKFKFNDTFIRIRKQIDAKDMAYLELSGEEDIYVKPEVSNSIRVYITRRF